MDRPAVKSVAVLCGIEVSRAIRLTNDNGNIWDHLDEGDICVWTLCYWKARELFGKRFQSWTVECLPERGAGVRQIMTGKAPKWQPCLGAEWQPLIGSWQRKAMS